MGRRSLFLLGFLLVGSTVFAASDTWNGTAADNDWLTTTNWVGGTVPGAGDTATFNGTAPGGNVSANTPANLAAIDVQDPHANSITLSQNMTLSGDLSMTSTNALAVLTMTNRTLTVGGNVTVQGNSSVVSGGTGSLVFTGTNVTWEDTSGGASTWHNVTINAGAVVRISNGSNITVNNLTINAGAELILSGGSTITVGGTQSGTVLRELVWIGGGGSVENHNNNGRWSPSAQPGNTDIAVFNGSGTGDCRVNADVTWYRVELRSGTDQLRVNDNDTLTLVDEMIVTGSTLDLSDAGAESGNLVTVDMTVNGGTVVMSTGQTVGGDANVSIDVSGNLVLSSGTWTKNATGRLRFSGNGQTWNGVGTTDWGDVVIDGTANSAVSATNALDVDDLQIDQGGLTMAAGNLLTVDGDLAIGDGGGAAGTADLTGNTGGVTLAGSLNITASDGDYTPGGGSFTFTGTGQTWDADGDTMGAVVINAGGTITVTNTDTTTTTLTMTAGTLSAGSRTLTATGAIAINGGTLDAGSGTVNANAALAINNGTLDTNTGSVVAASSTTIGNGAGGASTADLDNSAGIFEARGNLTVATPDGDYIPGGTLTFTTNPAIWTNNVAGENFGNVTINTGGSDTVTTSGTFTVGTLTMVSGELDIVAASTVNSTQVFDTGAQAGMTLTVNGILNVDSATNDEGLIWAQTTNATNLAVGAAGQLLVDREIYFSSSAGGSFTVASGGQISIADDFRYNTNTPLTQAGTITFTGANTVNMELRNASGNDALNFGDVVVNDGGAGDPFQPNNPGGGSVLVANFTLTAGNLDFDAFDDTLEITGVANLGGLGTFTGSSVGGVTELRFSGTGVTLTDGAQTTNLQTVEITGSVTLNSTILVTDLTINGATASLATGANTIQATGATDIRSGGSLNGNGGTVDLDGAVSTTAGSGTITMGSGALQFGNGSVNLSSIAVSQNAVASTTFNVNGTVTLTLGGSNDQFGNLTLANGGNNVNVSGGNLDVDGTLTIGNNTLAVGTTTVLLAGTLDASNNAGDITSSAGGGFTFNSTAAAVQTVTLNNETTGMNLGTVLVTRGAAARTVSIVGSGGTGDNFQARDVTVTTGTLDVQISTIIDGSTTAPSVTLSNADSTFQTSTNDNLQIELLSENGSNIGVLINGGTFSVTDAGAGGTNTVIFDEGDTVDLNTGTFRIRGIAGELTTVRDDTAAAGGRWLLDSQGGGTVDLAFVTLSDGDANPNQQVVVGGTDGGNNAANAFVFGTVWTGATDNQWDLNTNWSGNVLPSGTIPAVFVGPTSNGVNQPTTGSGNLPTIAGLLFLSSYTGNVATATVDTGLTVSGAFSFQSGANGDLSIANGQTLTLNGTTLTVNSAGAAISGPGSITFSGGAQQNLTIANGTSLPAVIVSTASTDLRPSANTLTLASLTVNADATMNLAANDPTLSVGAVTLNGNGAFTGDAGTTNVSGVWISAGGATFTTAHTMDFTAAGTITLAAGDDFFNVTNTAGARTQQVGSVQWVVNGALTATGGQITINGGGMAVAGAISGSGNITITGGTLAAASTASIGGTLTVTGTFDLEGNLSGGGAITGGGTMNLAGDVDVSGINLTMTAGTTTLDGGATQTIDTDGNNDSFFNLTVGANGADMTGSATALTVSGALLLNGDFNVNAGSLVVTGTTTVTAGDTLTAGTSVTFNGNYLAASAGTLNGTGNVVVNASADFSNSALSMTNGTFTMNSAAGQSLTVAGGNDTFNDLTIGNNGGVTILSGALDVDGDLRVESNLTLPASLIHDVDGTLTVTALDQLTGSNGGILRVGSTVTFTGTFVHNSGTVELDTGNANVTPNGAFNVLIVSGGTKTAQAALTATLLSVTAGRLDLGGAGNDSFGSVGVSNGATLDIGAQTATATGTFTHAGDLIVTAGGVANFNGATYSPAASGTCTHSGGTIRFQAATVNLATLASWTGSGASVFQLNRGALQTLSVDGGVTLISVLASNAVNIGGANAFSCTNLTIATGAFTAANGTTAITGNLTTNAAAASFVANGQDLDVNGLISGTGALSVGTQTVNVAGGFTMTTYTSSAGATLIFDGTGGWTTGANTYRNVQVTTGTTTVTGDVVINGNLTVSATLAVGSNNVSVAGASTSVTLTGGTYTQTAANTLTFNGSGTQVLIGGGNTIGSLVVSTSNVNITTSNVTVAGTTTVAATRTLAVASTVTLARFGTSNAATSLVSVSGILSLDADTTFSGNLTVNNGGSLQALLNPITIRFADTTGGSVTVVSAGGTIQVNPTVAGQTNLFSENTGTAWSLNLAAATETFADIRVQDSNASAGTPANSSAVDSDLGSNVNWPDLDTFTAVWDGSSNTQWSNANNWASNLPPTEGAAVSIPNGVPNLPQTNWSNLSITTISALTIGNTLTGTIRFTGAPMTVSSGFTIPNTVTFDAQDDLTVGGQVTIAAGATLDCDTSANVNVTVQGISGGTFVKPTGTGNLTITGGTWSGASDFGDVILTTAAPTTGSSLSMDTLVITGITLTPVATHNITVDSGAISGTGGLNLTNNVTVNVSGGLTVTTFTAGTSSVLNFNGTGNWGSTAAGGFGGVTITGNGTQVSLLAAKSASSIAINGPTAGARLSLAGFGLTVSGNVTLGDGGGNDGDLEANTGAAVVQIGGNLVFQDASTVITPTNLTTTFTGAGPHTLTPPNPTANLGNLPINATVVVNASGGSGTLRCEALTINATGALNPGTLSIQANGNVDLAGTFAMNAASTFTFGKTGAAVATETFNPGGKTLPNVVVTGTNKVVNQNVGSLTISGTTTIQSGARLQVAAGTANFASDGDGVISIDGANSELRMTVNTNFQDAVNVTNNGIFNAPEGAAAFTIGFDTAVATALSIGNNCTFNVGTAGGLPVDVDLRPFNNVSNDWVISRGTGVTDAINDVRVRYSTVLGTSQNISVDSDGVDLGFNTKNPPTNPGWQNLIAVNPTWTGAVSGDWTVDGNWNPSAPTAGSVVTFNVIGGNNPSAATQPTDLAGLITTTSYTGTIQLGQQLNLGTLTHAGGNLDLNGQILTLGAAVVLNREILDTNGAGSVRFTAGGAQTLTVNAGGASIQAAVLVGSGGSNTVLTGQAGSGRFNVEALTVDGGSTFNTGAAANIAVLVSQTTTVSALGTLTGNASDFTLAGSITTTGATAANFGTGTTQITGASTFNLANTTFGTLDINAAGNVVAVNAGTLTVSTLLSATAGTFTFNAAGSTLGSLTSAAGTTVNGAGVIGIGGAVTLAAGTFSPGGSTVNLTGGAQAISTGGNAFFNLSTANAGTDVVTGILDVNGTLTVTTNAVLQLGAAADVEGDLTVSGTGTLNVNGNNVNAAGATVDFSGGSLTNPGASTFTLDGGAVAFDPDSETFFNLTVASGSNATLGAPFTSSGTLTVTGTLAQSGNQITLTGTGLTPMTGAGVFTGNGVVLYNAAAGAGIVEIPALGFQNVTLNQSGRTYRNAVAVNLSGTLLTNAGTTFRLDNTFTAGSVSGAGTGAVNLNTQTLRLTGAAPFAGTALANLQNVLTSTVDYGGPAGQAVGNIPYGSVVFSGSGVNYTALPNPLTITVNLTFNNGAGVGGTPNVTFTGTASNSTFNGGTSSITLGTVTVTKQDLSVSSTNADLSFNGTSGTRVIQNLVLTTGRVLILEDATIQSGTIGAAGSAIQAQLRVASTGTNLTVGLAGQTRTITIFDSVQIGFGAAGVVCTMASGASTNTTFALNDADAELRFQGQSGNNIQVLTSTNGQSGFITSSVASFNSGRGASGLFASVRDNDASGYMDGTVSASSSIDLGNNVNWDFQGGGNITGIRATALGDGNGRIDRVQVMFGGTTGLQSSTLSTAHQQFALVQTDGSGNDLQSITGTASAIASTPSNRGLLVTFGSGLGKTDVTNVELRYTAPSSGFLTNTGGVPASISFTLTAAAGTLQDGAPPVLISSFFQDLDANDGLDRGSFFFSEPPAFKASCGVSISGWTPATNTTDMGGNTLLTLEIAGEQLAAIDVAQAPFTTGAQIAAEIQTRVQSLITTSTPASTNPGGHNPLNRPAYRNFTATFDGQRYIFKAGIPLRFDSATSQYVQDHSRSTVRVITGGANDVSAAMQLSPTNGGVERAGRGNARQGISVSESLASSGVAINTIGGTLSLQMNGEVSRSYTIATGSTTTAQVAALVETAVRGTVNDSTNDPDSVANADAYTNFVCVPDTANGGRLILISGKQGSGSSLVVDTLSSFATVAHIGSNFYAAGASERAGTSNTEVFLETLTVRLSDGSNPLLGKGDGDVSIAGNVVTVDLANVAGSGLATPAFQWRDSGGGLFFSDAAPVPNAASSPAGNFTASNAVVITGDSDGDLSVSRSPGAQVVDASGSLPPLGTTGVSASYSWTWVSGPSDPLSGSTFNGQALSFSATTAGTYVFRLTITVVDGSGNPVVTAFSDGQGRLIRDVTVVITEDKPIASAGADLTLVSANLQVQLDGTGSFDPNGGSIAYMWSAVNTATNTLVTPSPFDDDTISQPTFTAPASGRYTITLTVRKVNLETSQGTDTATVTITDPSSLFPVADAGDDQVGRINTQITLNGTASSHPASSPQALTYAWSIISSPEPVTLSDAAVDSPTFTPTTPGSYVFGLVVQTTGLLTSQTDQVTIQIIDDQATSPRVPPSAVALVAGLRNGVFLTGSAPAFNLSQPPVFVLRDGLERDVTVIDLAANAGDDPLSTAVAGFHKVEVMVSGSLFATLYAPHVTGDAQVVQLRPIKGETAIEDVLAYGVSGTSFVLDASNSQDDGVISTATWTQVSGPFQFTSQTGSLLAVVPQSAGTYVFDLVVTDNIGLSSFTSRVAVPVIPANLTLPAGPPSAAASVAGGQTVTIEGVVTFVAGQGQAVNLSAAGSISRVTGTPQTGSTLFTYNWTQLLGPTAVLAATNTEVVSAQLLVPGGYLFQVEVTDTNGVSSFAQVWISVGTSVANALVAAVATIQDAILPSDGNGLTVTFDASQSQGSGTGATYIWSQTAGSPVFVALTPGTGGEQGTVVITQPGTYTFTVRINDGTTTSAPQTISFKVAASAEQPLSSGASLKESSGGCALVADDRPRGAGAWLFLALGLILLVLRGRGAEERA